MAREGARDGNSRLVTERDREIINISFGGVVNLTVAEVWPDGDAPDEITVDAVIAVLERGQKWWTIRDWNLTDDLEVWASARGETKQAWT